MPSLPSRRVLLGVIGLFFAVGLAVYGSSLGNDFVRWDDGLLIYENTAVRSPSLASVRTFFTSYDPELYIPLTFLTYQAAYLIGGANAFVYHLISLLLHIGNALMVAWLVAILLRHRRLGLFAGLLFLAHPLHAEAVAWASALKDVQSTAFFLGSLLAYIYYKESGRRRTYWLSLALFLLGLLSKVVVLTLPAVLLLLDWREGRRFDRSLLREKIPYVLLSVVFGIVAVIGKQDTGLLSAVSTVLLACKSAVFLLGKLFVPVGFSSMYPYLKPISLAEPDIFIPVILVLLLTAAVAATLRWTRDIAFGYALFWITLAPWFRTFQKGQDVYFASDRFAYVPSVGVFLLAALALGWFLQSRRTEKAGIAIAAGLLVPFSALARRQSLYWRDSRTLFSHFVAVQPDSFVAHNNLGNAYRREGKLTEAIAEFQAAIAIRPHAKSYANLGAVYAKLGEEQAAVDAFAKSAALDPKSAEPSFGLGILYATLGKTDQALAAYARAIELNPGYAQAYVNRGSLLADRGDIDAATADFRRAVEAEPLSAQAHYNLAVMQARSALLDDAQASYETTIALQPSFFQARLNLGVLYARKGRLSDAREQFEAVLRYSPGNAAALSALRQLQAARSEE